MRTMLFKVALVAAACACVLAPRAHATGEQDEPRLVGQWRLFPRAPFAKPAEPEITSRITRQVDPLLVLFRKNAGEVPGAVGDSLIEIDARNQLFRLESLLRLYARAFPELDKYRLSVKEIEDGLGSYTFAVDALKFAKDRFKDENQGKEPNAARKAAQDKVIASLEKKRESARKNFERLADSSAMTTTLPELPAVVQSTFAGWSSAKDLVYVNGELQRTLKVVRDRRLNFNLMEDGIHEFRRNLRWFPMAIDSLDGLIMLRDDAPGSCPAPSLEALKGTRAARHRYANPALRNPATHPCTISRCLLWQVVKTVDDIGRLKDEVQGTAAVESALDNFEFDVASSNKVTPEEIKRAKASRDELYSSKALDLLVDQLNSCKP
jgi:hypothetical protein